MRWTVVLMILAAGCLEGPGGDPEQEETGEPAPVAPRALAAVGRLTAENCTAIEYTFPSPDEPMPSEQLPENMSFVLVDGAMQIYGLTRACQVGDDAVSFSFGGLLMNVTGALSGNGTHAFLIHIAVDGAVLLDALADWGLWVPEQRAWSIEHHDAEERTFVETDDAGDVDDSIVYLQITRFDTVRVQYTDARAQLPDTSLRWFELQSQEAGRPLVTMAVDTWTPAYSGTPGPASLQSIGTDVDLATGLDGDGFIGDGLTTDFIGRALPF